MEKTLTLGQYKISSLLQCFHCEITLSKSTPVELSGIYVFAKCESCGRFTPFRWDKAIAPVATSPETNTVEGK